MVSLSNFIRLLRETVPFRTIWGLVWPQTMMMFGTLVISLTDIWVAGRIDPTVQAAIGLSSQLQAFLMVLAMALGSGAMAAVSQSLGSCKILRAQRYAGLVIVLAVLMAIIVALAVFFVRSPILTLLQVPEQVRPLTSYFFTLYLLSLPAIYIFAVGGVLFRASRNVMMPLFIVVISCIINVIGDLGFGLGWFGMPAFGAPGLIWTTVFSVSVGAVLTIVLLRRCNLFVPGVIPEWRWIRCAAPYLLKVALPAMLTSFLWQTGYLTLYGITAALPDSATAIAGLTTGMRIEAILFMPGVAFNVTAAILVGNMLGAGDKAGARRIGLATVGTGVIIMSVVAACMWPFMPELAKIFSPTSSAVQSQIVSYLTYNILSTPFTVGGMILNGVMTGAGATIYALVINTSCIWLVRLPLGWFLAHVVWGDAKGVYVAMLISMAVQASAMLWVFFRRDWTKYAMKQHPSSKPILPSATEATRENA